MEIEEIDEIEIDLNNDVSLFKKENENNIFIRYFDELNCEYVEKSIYVDNLPININDTIITIDDYNRILTLT